jgi:thioesterase domain-containing protein
VDFLGLIDTYGKTALKRPEKVAPRMARHVTALHQRSLGNMAAYIGMRTAKNVGLGFAVACLVARECLPAGIGQRFIKPPSYALRSDLYAAIYRRALLRYAPRPYRGAITTFSAMGLSKFHKQHWQPFALGKLTVTEIPADHQSIICSPHSEELAARFDRCLDRTGLAIVKSAKEALHRSRRPDGMSASGELASPRRKAMALT